MKSSLPKIAAALLVALTVSACAAPQGGGGRGGFNPSLATYAASEAASKRSKGQRVWCVPYARDASGINIRGDAEEWWDAAAGRYARGKTPRAGAVIAFSGQSSLTAGHVGVVKRVVNSRTILINHANWIPNQVQTDVRVIDTSRKNDWSTVKVEYTRGTMGQTTYRLDGFIYAKTV